MRLLCCRFACTAQPATIDPVCPRGRFVYRGIFLLLPSLCFLRGHVHKPHLVANKES